MVDCIKFDFENVLFNKYFANFILQNSFLGTIPLVFCILLRLEENDQKISIIINKILSN